MSSNQSPINKKITRRTFLKTTALTAASAAFGFPNILRAGWSADKLNIAVVGTMSQAWWNISQIRGENIVAFCDVDQNGLDRAIKEVPTANSYVDYRVMLEKQKGIDAVLVATPDHHHAPAAARALRAGYHTYCEKPLAHSVYECRTLENLAVENKLATQMGTQIHAGENYRRVVELVQSGAIGPIEEAHVWCGKSWSNGRFGESKTPPANLNWDLWQGPATPRPYSDGIHPGNWRRFWDYGTGTLGDMACHYVDLVHWALQLTHPISIRSEGPAPHAVGTPAWMIVHYQHPSRNGLPPVNLTWYDGNKRPEILKQLKNADDTPLSWGDGQLFVGKNGMIISNYGGHQVLKDHKVTQDFTRPEPTIPKSIGHHNEWIKACKTGSPTTCDFAYSGPLSEAVLLGNVAFRSGQSLTWDPQTMKATGTAAAAVEKLVHPEFRKGWEV